MYAPAGVGWDQQSQLRQPTRRSLFVAHRSGSRARAAATLPIRIGVRSVGVQYGAPLVASADTFRPPLPRFGPPSSEYCRASSASLVLAKPERPVAAAASSCGTLSPPSVNVRHFMVEPRSLSQAVRSRGRAAWLLNAFIMGTRRRTAKRPQTTPADWERGSSIFPIVFSRGRRRSPRCKSAYRRDALMCCLCARGGREGKRPSLVCTQPCTRARGSQLKLTAHLLISAHALARLVSH